MSMRVAAICIFALLISSLPSMAQEESHPQEEETREEMLRRLRREKAAHLRQPEPPGRIERLMRRLERSLTGAGTGTSIRGFRPRLGGLKAGAGIAAGLVFDPFHPADVSPLQLEAIGSLRGYWGLGVRSGFRLGRAGLHGYARHRHMPHEDFYGLGGRSRVADRTDFRLNESVFGALLAVRFGNGASAGVRSSYVRSSPGRGLDDDIPDAHERWQPRDLPGLLSEARHMTAGAWLEYDLRDPPAPRPTYERLAPTESDIAGMPLATDRGVYVLGELVHYRPANDQPFGFTKMTIQSQQYLPLRHGRNVFAFREFLALTRVDESIVPLYMQPALGGAYTLRGFDLFRFRDRHALLFNAEYRWQTWLFADLVLFADAGQVFRRTADISVGALHWSYGGGVRLRTDTRGLVRLDVGRSKEGTQIHLRLSATF